MFEDIDSQSQNQNPYAIQNLESEIDALEKGVEAKKFKLDRAENELLEAQRIVSTKESNINLYKQDLDYVETKLKEKLEQLAALKTSMSKSTIDFNVDQSELNQYNPLVVNINYNSDDSILAAAEELSELIKNTLEDFSKFISSNCTEATVLSLAESTKIHAHINRPSYCGLGFARRKKEIAHLRLEPYLIEFLLKDNQLVFIWDNLWDANIQEKTYILAILVNP